MVINWYIIHTCMCILYIYSAKSVQLEHTTFENFTSLKVASENLLRKKFCIYRVCHDVNTLDIM